MDPQQSLKTPQFTKRLAEIRHLARKHRGYALLQDSIRKELHRIHSDPDRNSKRLQFRGWGHDLSDCHSTYVRHEFNNRSMKPLFRIVWRQLDNGRLEFINFGVRKDEIVYEEAAAILNRPRGKYVVGTDFDPSPTSAPTPQSDVDLPPLFMQPRKPTANTDAPRKVPITHSVQVVTSGSRKHQPPSRRHPTVTQAPLPDSSGTEFEL